MAGTFNCLILGAAGRDFHDFQTFFRRHREFRVKAFTATQIPFIAERTFPRSLAGPDYDADIPIYPEERLPELIRRYDIDFVFLAYSDLPHDEVMHKASLVQACGASFALLGPKHTQLPSRVPVIAVTGVRTGVGKSPLTLWLARTLVAQGRRVAVVRHPMPYGDLAAQAVERFETPADLDRFRCTIEEREEYQPYVENGLVVFAGVDYAKILAEAERQADVLLWDGGNNDVPFFRPDLTITVCDALRAGHELSYHPGEVNFRTANILVFNKVDKAQPDDLRLLREHAQEFAPQAQIVESNLEIQLDDAAAVTGRRVLVVEDGPTITHGGMGYGAGLIAARRAGAAQIVDPRPHAVGSIHAAFTAYPHIHDVLPALGYSPAQIRELELTIEACQPDVVVDASPAALAGLLKLSVPVVRVRYRFQQVAGPALESLVASFLANHRSATGESKNDATKK